MRKKLFLLIPLLFYAGCKKTPKYTKDLYFTMGTTLVVTMPKTQHQYADSIYAIFQRIDSLFHPTRPTSDVAKINSNSGKWVKVAHETADCIKKSLKISALTDGEFDITVGKLVSLWHFEQEGKYRIPPKDSIKKYRSFVDYRKVKVKGDSVFVAKGQRITLSGIAKGYALDLAKTYLEQKGVSSCIINAGGDMLALGKKGSSPWRIGIQSPWEKSYFKVLDVENKFVATSGNYVRFIKEKDTLFTHIFNPLTGEPLEYKKLSVTIIADSGYIADAFATALSVLGKDASLKMSKDLHVGLIAIYDSDTVINPIAMPYVENY